MPRWSDADRKLIEDAMAERLEGLLQPGEHLEADGQSDGSRVKARFVVTGGARGERLEFEAEIELAESGLNESRARDLALDALDLVLLEYLEGDREERPSGVFEDRELDGHPLRVRGERTFPALDAQANRWLEPPEKA